MGSASEHLGHHLAVNEVWSMWAGGVQGIQGGADQRRYGLANGA